MSSGHWRWKTVGYIAGVTVVPVLLAAVALVLYLVVGPVVLGGVGGAAGIAVGLRALLRRNRSPCAQNGESSNAGSGTAAS
ncbi:hypothetical protein [Nocardia sp. NPDC047648]|uniref:hypothetical protein n=1 Tax=Nocardia sp. NPDC047648 TaxID=3155625 RepID=UPI0033C5B22B